MGNFMDNLEKEAVRHQLGLTDNGAVAYTTCGDSLTDFNFNITSCRSADVDDFTGRFRKAFLENKELAVRYLFFAGDIREGLGERRAFKELMKSLAFNEPEIAKAVMKFIPEYGRWDEVLDLLETPLKKDAINMIKAQLEEDVRNMKENKPVSLCAKWMPSLQASNKTKARQALQLCDALKMKKSDYRHMLSDLRDRLNIIEKALAEKDVDKLDSMQESLSSKQNYKYKKALMNLIPEQRAEYFNKVLRGEANFNADVLEPHEIYFRYRCEHGISRYSRNGSTSPDLSYEVMWKQLPDKVRKENQVMVMRDGSGSMTCPIPNSNNGTVLDVASALTVYFAEHTEGQFKDKFITFSSRPEIVDLSGCQSLREKIELLSTYDDCSNTNLERAFQLILDTAVKNGMSQEDLPRNILIVSDMQFDSAVGNRSYYGSRDNSGWNETLFDTIRKSYEEKGYELPRLIFWNVNSRESTIPEVNNNLGVVLLGGYSKNNIDMICEDKFEVTVVNEKGEVEKVQLSPAEILANQLMSERYDPIGEAIRPILQSQEMIKNPVSNEER